MAILPILIAPNPKLKIRAKKVKSVDEETAKLMADMVETMKSANGIGLAAPQVGVSKRIIVVDISSVKENSQPLCMANPEIIWASEEEDLREEGCLSLPEQFAEVLRPSRVRVRYIDKQNEIREIEAQGILSVCIQHEIDHLDGKLFVDYLSALRRKMIIRKLQKTQKLAGASA
ncbi:MAG: peptide deformylase [Rhodospirillaceae bacterium]|nr:peptide deformylase [Rhodospirillaceae bacterium]